MLTEMTFRPTSKRQGGKKKDLLTLSFAFTSLARSLFEAIPKNVLGIFQLEEPTTAPRTVHPRQKG